MKNLVSFLMFISLPTYGSALNLDATYQIHCNLYGQSPIFFFSNKNKAREKFTAHQFIKQYEDNTTAFRCPCNTELNKENFESHFETHSIVKCPKCNLILVSSLALRAHNDIKGHILLKLPDLTPENEQKIAELKKNPEIVKTNSCTFCTSTFTTIKELENHFTEKHKIEVGGKKKLPTQKRKSEDNDDISDSTETQTKTYHKKHKSKKS